MASSSSSSPQQPPSQQQQQHQQSQDVKEEYLSAQRAAIEAIHVGRETLQQSVQQQEQLNRAESMADETEYKLDKAGRVLRGMTWSGWVANMFTKTVGPPPEHDATRTLIPMVYENIPPDGQAVAQTVQNYHANVNVLEQCETDEQKEVLKGICDSMWEAAQKELKELQTKHPDLEAYRLQLEKDLQVLQTRQKQSQERMRQLGGDAVATSSANRESESDPERAELFSSATLSKLTTTKTTTTKTSPPTPALHPHLQEQDQHLAIMAQSLGELGTIAQNLQHSMTQQNQTIDNLDTKADHITEKSKMVTRRADRLVQKRSWKPVKPTFHAHVTIRHLKTGRYLAALDAKDLFLVPRHHPDTCTFGLWKRQGEIFGLQNKHSSKWAGQSVFGSLACSSSSFGRREEWETGDNDDWTQTRLLCASAGWGAGGYLMVRPKDFALVLGGCTVEERDKADLWSIVEQT